MKRHRVQWQNKQGDLVEFDATARNARYHGKRGLDNLQQDFPTVYSADVQSDEWAEARTKMDEAVKAERPVYECDKCGKPVAWAVSQRTGGKYLCDVYKVEGQTGYGQRTLQFYATEYRPHFKSCEA